MVNVNHAYSFLITESRHYLHNNALNIKYIKKFKGMRLLNLWSSKLHSNTNESEVHGKEENFWPVSSLCFQSFIMRDSSQIKHLKKVIQKGGLLGYLEKQGV